nr:translation initiation factor IF-3 [bacterium]
MLINEDIRVPQVRVVDENGQQLGIMPTSQANAIAEGKELDLVMIAPQAAPPVCRIMDYGKYRFESSKREKENRKKQKIITVKEVQLSYSIEDRDLEIKARNAARMLKAGDKVRVSIRFRGRQIVHAKLGEGVMQHFAELIKDCGKVERPPKLEGRSMQMFVSPITPKE